MRMSCIRVRFLTWSRISSGAETIWQRSICRATRRALTAVERAIRSTRKDCTMPVAGLGRDHTIAGQRR